jgi:hypothetical protein
MAITSRGTRFEIFTEPHPLEVVEDAIVELFHADAELEEFFDGKIDRIPDMFAMPDRGRPCCLVGGVMEDRSLALSAELDVEARIGVALIYDESREEAVQESRTVRALVHRLWKPLAVNPTLENTASGQKAYSSGGALVQKLVGMRTIQYDLVRNDEGSTTSILQLQITYEWCADALTGNVTVA